MSDRWVFVNGRGFLPANNRDDWQAIEAAIDRAWRIRQMYGAALQRQVALEMRSLRSG